MLSGVLLHVIAAAINVDLAVNPASLFNPRRDFENVQNRAVIFLGYFGDTQPVVSTNNPACIKDLSAARGIERSAIEDERRPGVDGSELDDLRVEFVEERIVVVEMFRHQRNDLIYQSVQSTLE